MREIVFSDCEFRFLDDNDNVCCKNKTGTDISCDNCTMNVHLNCANYVPKNDMCLKYFELGISNVSQYDDCAEKTIYNDKELSRKGSN